MPGAGEEDRLIAFHAVTVAADSMGVEVETVAASPSARAWAKVLFGNGTERREAAAAGAVQSCTFRVNGMAAAIRAVTTRHIIRFDGDDWGISSISPVGPQGSEVEFVATKRSA